MAWGVRKSSTLNTVFTTFNLLTVGTVIVSGLFFGTYITATVHVIQFCELYDGLKSRLKHIGTFIANEL